MGYQRRVHGELRGQGASAAMWRPHWLFVLLWAFAVALAAPAGRAFDEGVFGEHEAVELVEIGESVAKDDGCSKAYEKFKANVDKMTTLKDEAVKKGEEADKKSRESVAGLKRCKDDQKEVLAKAEYKKDVMDKKIEEAAKKKFEEMKKPLEEKVAADKKKHDAALAEAKKKEKKKKKKKTPLVPPSF